MRYHAVLKTGVTILVPFALIACGDGDRDTRTGTPITFSTSASSGERIGGNFMAMMNADNTSTPREPTAADVPPLDVTAKPIND